jgi:tyrosine-protein kinase Etk/Wzc
MATETHFTDFHDPGDAAYAAALSAGETSKKELSFLDILVVLTDYRRLIFWITAVSVLVAIPVTLLLPKRFTATVTVLPPRQGSGLGSLMESQLSGIGGSSQLGGLAGMAALAGSSLGLKNPNSRYVGMFRSRIVEDAVIQQFGLMKEYDDKYLSDARRTFERRTRVDGNAKDGMIHISVEDRDPQRSAAIANAYVEQFRKLSEHLAVSDATERRDFFQRQLEQAKDNLANAEEALKATELKTGLIEVNSQARALIDTVANLRAQIAAREMIIQGMETYATGQNAQLTQAEQELASLRTQLAKLGGNQDTADGLIVPKGKVPEAALEYVRRLRDVKYYETIFEVLARQFELAKLDEAKQGAAVQVVDPAVVPDKRSFPKRSLIVIGAALGGLIIGIFTAFGLAALRRMREDPETAIKLTHIGEAIPIRRKLAAHH